MQKQYGKEEGKKVYFATIRKQAMESVDGMKMPPLPGLGGGGGGTNSITDKAKTKSLGKRITDVGKLSTVPARFFIKHKIETRPHRKIC